MQTTIEKENKGKRKRKTENETYRGNERSRKK